jgi:hypothetical protein
VGDERRGDPLPARQPSGADHVLLLGDQGEVVPISAAGRGLQLGAAVSGRPARCSVADLGPAARASFELVHGLAVVGDEVVVLLGRELVVLDADLQEYLRVPCPGPGKLAVDAEKGWLHVAGGGLLAHVFTLDVRAGRLRWQLGEDVSGTLLTWGGDGLLHGWELPR